MPVASAAVGPEPISSGGSPTTSEIARVTSRAAAAARASRPPLNLDRWRRTQLISRTSAPERSKAAVRRCFSARASPSPGRQASAEAPPLSSTRTRSSGPASRARPSSRSAAATLASSGTGWAEPIVSIRGSAIPLPRLVTARPDSGPSHCASTTAAI
ncbi:MAG TPA: hypothetical protein VF605_02685 [Allosphingosinicella sp.]